jgi:hypothetical protein
VGSATKSTSPVPLLWITGPAGVGKSSASWRIFTELADDGAHVAFADADQFCMCYPAPAGDPGREHIKAKNIGALVPRYRAAGARCVIVNGVMDPQRNIYTKLMPQAGVTFCRLRANRDELALRLVGRQGSGDDREELLAQTLDEADAMDASSFADVCIDTTGVPEDEVAALVRDGCRDWPGFRAARVPGESRDAPMKSAATKADGTVLLICGATGVGKSTVGFQLYLRWLRAGLTAGYVDLEQIGLVRPGPANDPGRHRLKAGNLAAIWSTYHDGGATHLIATGPADSDAALQTYVRELPAANVTVCRLHAGHDDLARRIMSRREGGSWPQPGDPLRGQSAEYLRRVADHATADASSLDRANVGTIRIENSGRTVEEVVDMLEHVRAASPSR